MRGPLEHFVGTLPEGCGHPSCDEVATRRQEGRKKANSPEEYRLPRLPRFKYFLFIVLASILFPTINPDDVHDDAIKIYDASVQTLGNPGDAILETQSFKNIEAPACTSSIMSSNR